MATEEHEAALRAYDEALDRLYGTSLDTRVAAAEDYAETPRADEAAAEAFRAASESATESTAALLESDDPNVRAAGEVRLAALAARDFAVAFDVARLEDDEDVRAASADAPAAVLPGVESEVAFVFARSPAEGVPRSEDGWDGLATLAADEDPRDALQKAAASALTTIRDDATAVVLDGVKRAGETGLDEFFGQLARGVFEYLPDRIKRWWHWAMKIFKQGVEKLRKLFGKAFDALLDKIHKWLKDNGAQKAADIVYGIPGLTTDIHETVATAPEGTDFAAVGESVKSVVERHATQKKVVLAVFKGLGWLKPVITKIIAPPNGDIAVGAVFVLGASYGLYSGGDYVDWRRTDDDGFLDFVKGVRQTVEDGVGGPPDRAAVVSQA